MQTQTRTQPQEYWTATAMAATKTKTKTPVTLHDEDGSMYVGHVNDRGEKHGQGMLKTAIYITGCMGDDNSHLMKWTEYTGNWCNGLLHGQGVMRKMCGNGVIQIVHDGMWDNGVPLHE